MEFPEIISQTSVILFSNRSALSITSGVTDGTRTRNSQNHNLELYH